MCSCWGTAPSLPGALCHPPTCRAPTREGGWFGRGVKVLFLVTHLQAESPLSHASFWRSSPSHHRQCVCSTGTSLGFFYLPLVPFLALVESLLIYSWCHMKSEAGALLPRSHPGLPCFPCSSQCLPGSLSLFKDMFMSKPKFDANMHRLFLYLSAPFFIIFPFFNFPFFLKETESKAAM